MLLVGALATGVWAIKSPDRFVLFAVLPTQIYPLALFTPFGVEIAIADLLLVVALVGWLIAGAVHAAPGPWLRGNPLLLAVLLFVAVTAISTAWSVNQRETLIHVVQMVQIVIVLPLVFASLPPSLRTIRAAFYVYIAATCLMALITFAIWLPRAAAGQLEGQYLPGLNKNAIGSYVGAGLVLAYGLWLGETRWRHRLVLAFAAGVEAVGLFASVSRGSIIGAVVAVLTMSFLLRRRRRITVGLVAAAAAVFLTFVGYESGVDRSLSGSYDSSVVRTYSFPNAVDKIAESPLLGTGAGTYSDYIPQIPITVLDPNNMFLLTWAELGIFGLLLLLLLLHRYVRLWSGASKLSGEAWILGTSAGGVTMSFFVHFQVDVTWTRGTTALAFAMLGLLAATTRLGQLPSATRSRRRPGSRSEPRARPPMVAATR